MKYHVSTLVNLINFAAERGADPEDLCRLSNIDQGALQEQTHIEMQKMNALWHNAAKATNDPLLGLHLGESLTLAALGIVGEVIQNSPNVKKALENACDYLQLITDVFKINMETGDSSFQICLIPDPHCLAEYSFGVMQGLDAALVFVLKEYQFLGLGKTVPNQVNFMHDRRSHQDEYQRIFRCPVFFKQNVFSISFSDEYLAKPIFGADFELLQLLRRYAEDKLSKIQSNKSITGLVKKTLLNHAFLRPPTIHEVASQLNYSTRSLQRKLGDEGNTYKQLFDEVKKEIAIHGLKKGKSIKEMAYVLGYNDVSSFTRSFSRWTGQPPGKFVSQN